MILPDVNVLVYAYREETADHAKYRRWLQRVAVGGEPLALAEVVLAGLVRIVTHPRIFKVPSPVDHALGFVEDLFAQPASLLVRPGARHWAIFARICREADASGNLVPDAFLAALAVEHGCEIITTDSDFARFKGVRWRHPLA